MRGVWRHICLLQLPWDRLVGIGLCRRGHGYKNLDAIGENFRLRRWRKWWSLHKILWLKVGRADGFGCVERILSIVRWVDNRWRWQGRWRMENGCWWFWQYMRWCYNDTYCLNHRPKRWKVVLAWWLIWWGLPCDWCICQGCRTRYLPCYLLWSCGSWCVRRWRGWCILGSCCGWGCTR